MVSEDQKFNALYDHYKDTFLYIREYLKLRERFFVYLLIIISLQFVQISFIDEVTTAFNSLVENKIGLNFNFSNLFINNVLWFVLFSFCLKYFQTNILISRQYKYLHFLESKISKSSGDKSFITREGKSYLDNYPIFSDWAYYIYSWVFPLLLIIANIAKIYLELSSINKVSLSSILSFILFLAVFLNTVFYMIAIHYKKKK